MKVAMMVRAFLQTPAPNGINYSPASVAQAIAEGLAKKGHEVTFFGPEGSTIDVPLVTCNLRPTATTQDEVDNLTGTYDIFSSYAFSLGDSILVKSMFERAAQGEFDCLVFHHFESALPYCSLFPQVPVVFILHDPLDEKRRDFMTRHAAPNQHYISISNNQRRNAPDLPYAATIYNGVDTSYFSYSDESEDYLFYCGRITPIKGVKEAVQTALQTRKRLLIAGPLSRADHWYFEECIKPYLDDKILFLGMLDREQLVKYFQKASALLVPIQWEEPFGLTMIEANACGTPVIALNRGSVPEVVKDNKSGFVVDNSAEMIMAISKLDRLKRSDCRKHVENNFALEKMLCRYEEVLQSIVDQHRTGNSPQSSSKTKLKMQINTLSKHLFGTK